MGRVVVYGGTCGIGRATAEALRHRGFGLHLAVRDRDRFADAGWITGPVIGADGGRSRLRTKG